MARPSKVAFAVASSRVWQVGFFALLSLVSTIGWTQAGPPRQKAQERNKEGGESFPRDSQQGVLIGAAALFGLGCQGALGSPAQLAYIRLGEEHHLWALGTGDRAIPLIPGLLAKVRDHRPIANGLDPAIDDAGELTAYADAVAKASLSPVDAIANGARHDVSRTNLVAQPHLFRGEVIHSEGKLRLIEKLPAPLVVSYLGVHELYEAWVFEQGYGANPSCLLLTELPDGLKPGPQNDVPVSFDGYFFKIYRYKSRDPDKASQEREAPLFISRTLTVLKRLPPQGAPEGPVFSLSSPLLAVFLGLIVCSLCLAVGLTWWFRRNDNRVRQRLKASTNRELQLPDTDSKDPA